MVAEPTYSVVELPKTQHPDQPVPEEAIIYRVLEILLVQTNMKLCLYEKWE